MQQLNLTTAPMQVLVAIRNDLLPDKPIKGYSQRSVAIEQLQKLAKEKGVALTKTYDGDGKRVPAPQAAASKANGKKAPKVKEVKEKGPVIRKVAEELLLQIVGKDEDGRVQGRPYQDILDEIHERFEGSQTSVACLRWYAVRMRERGEKVPNRPRAKPEVAAEE